MDFYVKDGVIVRAASEDEKVGKKKVKGDGIKSALSLLQELRDFQEKVEDCIEAQDIAENKSMIEEQAAHLEEMYKALLKIAESGIRSWKDKGVEGVEGVEGEGIPAEAPVEAGPTLPSTPRIPEASKIP